MENLNLISERLVEYFSPVYRKIWVQKSSRNNDVLLTFFPSDLGGYQMKVIRNLSKVSFEEIIKNV